MSLRSLGDLLAWHFVLLFAAVSIASAQDQTPTVTPIDLSGNVPYRITLREYDIGSAELPRLHSYAAGHVDGKWLLIAGRTNGVHDIDQGGLDSFPPEFQNRDVWVIDPVAKQSWRRSLGDPAGPAVDPASGLTTRMAEEAKKAGKSWGGHMSEPADYIPEDAQGNSSVVEIEPGEQTLDFAITGPPRP